jgi:hypothetical protein
MTLDHDAPYLALEKWVSEAKRSIRDDSNSYRPPDLEKLCNALEGGAFKRATVDIELDDRGRSLLQLETLAPDATTVSRYMLPAHAATARALELSGGRIALILGSGGAINKAYFDLTIGDMRTNLHRILFGVTSTGRLWERKAGRLWEERKGDSHRYVVPSAYRQGPGSSREIVLDELAMLHRDNHAGGGSANSAEAVGLLIDLFAISDIWHWDELAGRNKGRQYGLEDCRKT